MTQYVFPLFCTYRFSQNGQVEEVKILDFQNTRIGRPGIELAYFLCSSVSPKQRKEHLQVTTVICV